MQTIIAVAAQSQQPPASQLSWPLTGIIALIDEATGYQKVRARNALQVKLQAFIADELQEWAVMFPESFWIELARLEGVRYPARSRPLRWGKYVMLFVYDAIDEDVGRQLRKKNPNPRFLRNHHQNLSANPAVRVVNLGGVIAVALSEAYPCKRPN